MVSCTGRRGCVVRDEFFINRNGKRYVLYSGLLNEAHSRGLKSIDTELLQVPNESNGNVAISKARVEMEDGSIFTGIGDASPDNVGRAIAVHIVRMSETRSKCRALRDATNIGATSLEELGDNDDSGGGMTTQTYNKVAEMAVLAEGSIKAYEERIGMRLASLNEEQGQKAMRALTKRVNEASG